MGQRGRKPHPDILTPREWDVLALLKEGLSNPDIAGRLGISREAVKYHVSEILSKLDVATREEAAAWEPPSDVTVRRPRWSIAPVALRIATAVAALALVAGVAALAWGIASSDGEDEEPAVAATAEATPATELPPRRDTVAPWLETYQYPLSRDYPNLIVPLPGCGDDWRPSQPLPDCPVTIGVYDPTAQFDTPLNPCEERTLLDDPVIQEMQRRAQLRNEAECVNGWQYEWEGLGADLTPAPTPSPTPGPDTDPGVRDDGVLSFFIAEFEPTVPGDSGQRSCIADARVYVKGQRVDSIANKGRLIRIDIGEPIQSDEPLPDYDVSQVPVPVHRDEQGELVSGFRDCIGYRDCYADGNVIVYKGLVARVMATGEGVVMDHGEPVRGEADQPPLTMYNVFRADDGVLEIGFRHCDPEKATPSELPYSGSPERDFATPVPWP